MHGNCASLPSANYLSKLNRTSSPNLKPGQCIVALNTGLLRMLRPRAVIANLMIYIAPIHAHNTQAVSAIRANGSNLWMENMTLHGGNTQFCSGASCFLTADSSFVTVESALLPFLDELLCPKQCITNTFTTSCESKLCSLFLALLEAAYRVPYYVAAVGLFGVPPCASLCT